jgi:predicted lipoprotein
MRTTAKRSRRLLRLGVVLVVVIAALAILRPWTVVPIHTTATPAFDAEDYVESIWSSRVLPAAERTAIDLQTFMTNQAGADAAGGQAAFVTGAATVAAVDRSSRVGLARLRLPWNTDGRAAALQIGPVLRGTALRDALDFIRFSDFVNQLEFASVANALNQRVVTGVLGTVDVDDLAGREVGFVGAVTPGRGASTFEIVPVQLHVAAGPP